MPKVLDIEQAVLLLEIEPPFDKRDIQLARRRLAKQWHPDIAPPGNQLEHERHLKAVNEAADQLAQLAEESRGGRVSQNAVKVWAAAARKRRAEEGARAYAEEQRQRAQNADNPKHDPFASRVPDHSVVHRYARCLSYPEWGVGQRQRHLLHRRRRRHPAVGAGLLPARHPHRSGGLAAVRRLLEARPRRRARPALHDRGQARAGREQLQARRPAARLRARRRPGQHRGAAAADARVLAGGRLQRGRPRGARLDPRRARPPGALPLRRAHLRGHGRAVAGGGRRRARGRGRAHGRLGLGAAGSAAAAHLRPRRARARRSSARARPGRPSRACSTSRSSRTCWATSAPRSRPASRPPSCARSPRRPGRATPTRSPAPTASSDCLEACERALALADDPEVRDLRDQVARMAPRELARRESRRARG